MSHCLMHLTTLKNEKKRRQCRKKLNLINKEDISTQLFHSSKVYTTKAFKAEIQAKTTTEKAEKDAKKIQGVENKYRKEQEA